MLDKHYNSAHTRNPALFLCFSPVMHGVSAFQSSSEVPALQKSYRLSKCTLWGVWEGIFASRVVYFMLNPHSESSNGKHSFLSIGVQCSVIYLTHSGAHHSLLEIC